MHMNILAIAALAFAPGIFWLWYFYRKDKIEPEPKQLIIKVFLLGMLAAVPAAIIEFPFLTMNTFVVIVIVAPIVEEIIKYLFVRHGIYRGAEFDEPMDGIVYACAVALGFASLENVGYLLQIYMKPDSYTHFFGVTSLSGKISLIFLIRALLTVPGHALWSSMWGYALGWAKFLDEERGKPLIVKGILLAILSHAVFNFLLLLSYFSALGMLILVPVLWRIINKKIAHSIDGSPHVKE